MNKHSRFSLAAVALLAIVLAGRLVSTQEAKNPGAAGLKNPVAATPESIAAGKKAFDANCAGCHGNKAQGAVKAGIVISIIQEQGGKQAPDLTDDKWDHGSTDGEIYTVTRKGVAPTMMAGWEGRISDTDIWNIVNYLRALAANPNVAVTSATAAPAAPALRERLELADYVQMPITGEPAGELTRGLLARVNFMREEPGSRRFFVNDLNGPLYILDKKTKQFTTYLDFNGLAGRPGLFQKLTFERNFASGLINVIFDPDYARNGVFYTIHMEDPTTEAPAEPKPGVVPGLDLSGYKTTPAIVTPIEPSAKITREAVMIEWTDRNIANATFEGTARELLRVQLTSAIHPLGEMTFNPAARRGDPDWRVMYVGSGDSGSGEQKDIRRMNPQRLDNLAGKILRIVPDLREHTATSTVSENGRYRIPNDNPFVSVEGARKEVWALGLRNPHRLIWDVDPAQPLAPRLLAFVIGLTSWETVVIVKKGANYGYSLREGPQAMTLEGMTPVPADDTIPMRITDTVTRGTMKPTYPVIAYPHTGSGGDAIAGGFVYRGTRIPALKGKLLFGDITTGRIWYAEMADVLRADDGDPTTLAPLHELDAGLRRIVEETYRARGGRGEALPGAAAVSGRGRVDVRFAEDGAGELYLLTKSDGMIRQVVGVTSGQATALVSPEVHHDRTVTFRIRFPQATTVTLTGDWLATPATPTGGTLPMTKDADGVWSVTSEPLEPTVHLYFFTVDGQAIADPINPRMKLRVRTSASLVEVPGSPVPPWQVRDIPHGSMDWNVQHSTAYNDTHEFMVYLPPGYFQGAARYPVLYLVHGAGDTAMGWGTAGAANLILDSLIADKKAVPMIVVMPFNGSNNPAVAGGGGRGAGGTGGAPPAVTPFEEYMLKDLIPFVDAKYRVRPGRENRAMAGLSAGGAATYNIGLKHLELFSAFGLFSAAGGGGADFATRYPQLAANAKDTNARIKVFWIGCGTADPLDAGAKTLDAELTRLQIVHTYMDREGGHVWPVWRWALSEFAPRLFQK